MCIKYCFQRNTLLPRSEHRKNNNIKMDIKKTGWEDVGKIHYSSLQGPIVGSLKRSNEYPDSIKGRDFPDQLY